MECQWRCDNWLPSPAACEESTCRLSACLPCLLLSSTLTLTTISPPTSPQPQPQTYSDLLLSSPQFFCCWGGGGVFKEEGRSKAGRKCLSGVHLTTLHSEPFLKRKQREQKRENRTCLRTIYAALIFLPQSTLFPESYASQNLPRLLSLSLSLFIPPLSLFAFCVILPFLFCFSVTTEYALPWVG